MTQTTYNLHGIANVHTHTHTHTHTQAWFHASTMAGAIEELMLLEQGLVDTSELESFRQARTDQHQVRVWVRNMLYRVHISNHLELSQLPSFPQ